MFGLVKVLGSVLVLGGVATAHVTALKAQAQVNPCIAHLEALFTTFATRSDLLNVFGVTTGFRHGSPHLFAFRASRTAVSIAKDWNQFG
jgi:hypothetical protein